MPKFVVSAAIVDSKKKQILLAKRAVGTTYEKHWCTPGGKVEDETQFEALRRELTEEIRATFRNPYAMFSVVYCYDIPSTRTGDVLTVVCYRVPIESIEGIPSCGDKTSAVGWFQADELADLKMTPADRANADALIRAISAE